MRSICMQGMILCRTFTCPLPWCDERILHVWRASASPHVEPNLAPLDLPLSRRHKPRLRTPVGLLAHPLLLDLAADQAWAYPSLFHTRKTPGPVPALLPPSRRCLLLASSHLPACSEQRRRRSWRRARGWCGRCWGTRLWTKWTSPSSTTSPMSSLTWTSTLAHLTATASSSFYSTHCSPADNQILQ